jgi:Ca2+-binding RTX toxin-like protein
MVAMVRKLALALLALLVSVAPASGSQLFPVNGGAVLNALPGEVNRVQFKRSGGTGIFTDRRNPLATDEPCESVTSQRARCPLDGRGAVGVSLGDRNDRFRVVRGSRLPRGSIVEGGRGDDRLRGGPGREKISGGRGDDVIFAGKGKDTIDCGRGRDRVVAERQDALAHCEIVRRP